jgi:hypothetical protein
MPAWGWNNEVLSIKAFASLLAYCALTAALVVSLGYLNVGALVLLGLALGFALAGTCLRCPGGSAARHLVPFTLCFVVGGELVGLCVLTAGVYAYRGFPLVPFLAGSALMVLLVVSYAWGRLPWPRARFLAVLGVFFFLGAWHIKSSPDPGIDVWHFQERGVLLLLGGKNPYAAEYPIREEARFYGPTIVKGGQVLSCPYPPLSLLLAVPGYLLGDVRWALLLALVGAAALMAGAGRALGLPPGHLGELAPVAFLCHPLALAVLERAWTEPLVTLAASYCAWAMAAGRGRALGVGLAGLISVKQYGFLWAVLLCASGHVNRRNALLAGALAGLINLPFVLWNPPAFWRGVFAFQIDSPFRADSLTVLAALKAWTGIEAPAVVGFLAAAGTLLIVRRARPSLTDAALGGAAVFLSFFMFNKGAHLNYYWFTGSLLPIAVVASAGESLGGGGRAGCAAL